MDHIRTLIECAEQTRVAQILYRKPREKETPKRRVETYKFVEGVDGILVRCFQVGGDGGKAPGWRCFKADMIVHAEPDRELFVPRTRITISDGEIHPFTVTRRPRLSKQDQYYALLEQILWDGVITTEERHKAKEFVIQLDDEAIRTAHARIFADVIREMLIDGTLSSDEQVYLASVRNFLDALGWSP